MYSLPSATIINKPLYKKTVFEKFNLKAVERERFDADISRMELVAQVSSSRIPALKEGVEIKSFYVLQVTLKRQNYDLKNILLLQKLIPQKMVYALQYEDKTRLCVFHNCLLQSEWKPTEEMVISINGLALDDVWNNIVASIGSLDVHTNKTIEEQIINREKREKLLRQIDYLEKQCRTEKQRRNKYELHKEILKLKEELYGK